MLATASVGYVMRMMPNIAETAVHAWLRSARVQISAIVNPRKPFMFLNEKNSTTAPYLASCETISTSSASAQRLVHKF